MGLTTRVLSVTLILAAAAVTACSSKPAKESPPTPQSKEAAKISPDTPLPDAASDKPMSDKPKIEVTANEFAHPVGPSPTPSVPSAHEWTYTGDTGPTHWADLNPAYALCSGGKEQSPINLVWHKPKKKGGEIKFHYQTTPFTIVDNGHTVQVQFQPGNYITLGEDRYDLVSVDFHSSSEHTIAGVAMPMEMDLLHKNERGEIAMLGVVLIQGPKDGAIQVIWDAIPQQKNIESKSAVALNPIDFIPKSKTHYSYVGSLMTPPCTEGVNWNVFNTPLTLSKDQILAFRKLYSSNNRPVQPLNDRQVVNY